VTRKDGSPFNLIHFFEHPQQYENAFLPYAHSADLLISAAYWDPRAPVLFTSEEMRQPEFRIRIISDITCDIGGSIPSTKRPATIDEPFYDYNPETGELEPPFHSEKNITVQAVDNLPNELPKDASEDFGRNLIDKVFPDLLLIDAGDIIERAVIAKDGELTPRFKYLQAFADGNSTKNA
jgi:saccharopine dehydrogenase (NAD+, L-lysine forming)